ncbi:hypothetical protein JCM13304A_10130 [Desulfothermus okinawensis JCM 13304]
MVFINIVTAKELKQRTGEIIKRIRAGEKLTITYRGRPVAAIIPISEKEEGTVKSLRPFKDAWRDIEKALDKTEPYFSGWEEATRWVRKRT